MQIVNRLTRERPARYAILASMDHRPGTPAELELQLQLPPDSLDFLSGSTLAWGAGAVTTALRCATDFGLSPPQCIFPDPKTERTTNAAFACFPARCSSEAPSTSIPSAHDGSPAGGLGRKGLYRWTADSSAPAYGWVFEGAWEESHVPHSCREMRSGYPERVGAPRSDKHTNVTP